MLCEEDCFDSFDFTETEDGKTIVTYRGKTSKASQGGLKRRKLTPKEVNHVEDGGGERYLNIYICQMRFVWLSGF